MKALRKVLFWLHLVIGIAAGGTIAITAFTGAMMAFEKQVIAWVERDARRVVGPTAGLDRMPVEEILEGVRQAYPESRPMGLTLVSDPAQPIVVSLGRNQTLYANPYTGELKSQGAQRTRAFFQLMLRWHRWLGVNPPPPGERGRPIGEDGGGRQPGASTPGGESSGSGGARQFASTVVGVSSIVFCVLSLTGLILWWPRSWSLRALRAGALLNLRLSGKARDWNWHNVIGLWTSPLILVMGFTGILMAFRGMGNLVYGQPTGGAGGGGGSATNAPAIIVPAGGGQPLTPGALIARAQAEVPDWSSITLRLGNGRERGGRGGGGGERPARGGGRGEGANREVRGPQPASIMVRRADGWLPLPVQLQVSPYTGEVLKREEPGEMGVRQTLRQLNRTLHTGEAVGIPGQALALTGCLGGLLLVYTGFALSWRRLRAWRIRAKSIPVNASVVPAAEVKP
jgi:uncharacterized iron-regulated membrane protein